MLTDEQVQQIKEQLAKQLENFPEDKRQAIKDKIMSMSNEEIEQFLKENELSYPTTPEAKEQQCIFCAIVSEKIKSYKIDENEKYISILEINPLSKGHALIIPKKHIGVKELNDDSLDFAKKISEKINRKFTPKEIKLSKNEILGHAMIELIPTYGNEGEKHPASGEELTSLQSELVNKKEEKVPEIPALIPEAPKKLPKIPPRLKWI